jgi:hypothetical protein
MEIQGTTYSVSYNAGTHTVKYKGVFNIRGSEGYKEISAMLNKIEAQISPPAEVVFDIRETEFLNSSGITTMGKFVIRLRQKTGISLTVLCSNRQSWQEYSMKGLEKLMPVGLTLKFE